MIFQGRHFDLLGFHFINELFLSFALPGSSASDHFVQNNPKGKYVRFERVFVGF